MNHSFMQLLLISFVTIIVSILLVIFIVNKTYQNGVKSAHWLLLLVPQLLALIVGLAYEVWMQVFYFQTGFSITTGFLFYPAIIFAICTIPVMAKIYSKKVK